MKIQIDKKDLPKRRNIYAMALAQRGGGGKHEKPYKTKRAQDKIALRKQIMET